MNRRYHKTCIKLKSSSQLFQSLCFKKYVTCTLTWCTGSFLMTHFLRNALRLRSRHIWRHLRGTHITSGYWNARRTGASGWATLLTGCLYWYLLKAPYNVSATYTFFYWQFLNKILHYILLITLFGTGSLSSSEEISWGVSECAGSTIAVGGHKRERYWISGKSDWGLIRPFAVGECAFYLHSAGAPWMNLQVTSFLKHGDWKSCEGLKRSLQSAGAYIRGSISARGVQLIQSPLSQLPMGGLSSFAAWGGGL